MELKMIFVMIGLLPVSMLVQPDVNVTSLVEDFGTIPVTITFSTDVIEKDPEAPSFAVTPGNMAVLRTAELVFRITKVLHTVFEVMKPAIALAEFEEQEEIGESLSGPLMLTPYIESLEMEKARNLSEVSAFFKDGSPFPPSHAGFLTVDKKLGNHLHFWFFPSISDPKAPLMVWMNGGPTLSSMQGLLWSHGPVTFRKKYTEEFARRKETWVGPFSIVYVDIAGRGFSFSESGEAGEKVRQEDYAADLYEFVKQFLQIFPEYQARGVYIAGQSYAGHFVPALAHAIHTANINKDNFNIKLNGVILGAPVFHPEIQDLALFDFLYAMGGLNFADMKKLKANVTNFHAAIANGMDISQMTLSDMYAFLIPYGAVNRNLLHNYITGEYADHNAMQRLMNKKSTRKMVHAGDQSYRHFNFKLYNKFGSDYFVSTRDKLADLMNHYKVLIYNGDLDLMLGSLGIDNALLSTPWKLQEEYKEAERHQWKMKYKNNLKGYFSTVGQFCRVIVHGAGHEAPHDQPVLCLEMVKDFLEFGCIRQP